MIRDYPLHGILDDGLALTSRPGEYLGIKRERPCWTCGHDAIDHDLCNYGDCKVEKCICRCFVDERP